MRTGDIVHRGMHRFRRLSLQNPKPIEAYSQRHRDAAPSKGTRMWRLKYEH
jgi:hypothetical protein